MTFLRMSFCIFLGWGTLFPVSAQINFNDPVNLKPFKGPRVTHQCVTAMNYLFLSGGYSFIGETTTVYNDIQVSKIAAEGTISDWSLAGKLSQPLSGHGSVFYNGYLYVIGGSDKDFKPLTASEYGRINPDGTIAFWKKAETQLNIARSNLSASVFVNAKGKAFLYAIAGVGQVRTKTVHYPSIEIAPIGANGAIGPWTVAAFPMKGGRSAPAGFIFHNRLYVVGGWGDLLIEDVFANIQYAPLLDDASLDPWYTNPYSMRLHMYGHTASIALDKDGPYLVTIGGNLGQGNIVPFIQFSKFGVDGSLGSWSPSVTQIKGKRWGHSTAMFHNMLYVTGGTGGGTRYYNDVQLLTVKP